MRPRRRPRALQAGADESGRRAAAGGPLLDRGPGPQRPGGSGRCDGRRGSHHRHAPGLHPRARHRGEDSSRARQRGDSEGSRRHDRRRTARAALPQLQAAVRTGIRLRADRAADAHDAPRCGGRERVRAAHDGLQQRRSARPDPLPRAAGRGVLQPQGDVDGSEDRRRLPAARRVGDAGRLQEAEAREPGHRDLVRHDDAPAQSRESERVASRDGGDRVGDGRRRDPVPASIRADRGEDPRGGQERPDGVLRVRHAGRIRRLGRSAALDLPRVDEEHARHNGRPRRAPRSCSCRRGQTTSPRSPGPRT